MPVSQRAALAAFATLCLCSPASSQADDEHAAAVALAELDLDQLMSLRVPSMTSVLGGHVHNRGENMPMLRWMQMDMRGLRDGTQDVSSADVLLPSGPYMVAPTSMTMDVLAAGWMYGVTDDVTIMGMLPYRWNSMSHVTAMGGAFTTNSSGPGDVMGSVMAVLAEGSEDTLIFDAGFSLPTGSIDARDTTPAGPDQLLPYPMQLGSGTFDLRPRITWAHEGEQWAAGASALAVARLGRNDHDYSLGNRLQLEGWVQRSLSRSLAVSLDARGETWGNVNGMDPGIAVGASPTADPTKQGGTRVELALGLELYVGTGLLEGQSLDLTYGIPVYEDLDGPQMSLDHRVTLSWSLTF